MEPGETEGQAASTDLNETTDAAPLGDQGQSISPDQTTASGPDQGAQGESFFDPKSIEHSPELMQAYKQMQGKFTQGQQSIRESQQKLDAYEAYERDPMGTMRQLAAQYGMTLVNGQPAAEQGAEQFNPNSWEDVVSHVTQQVRSEMETQYAPLVGEVKSLKQQNIEQYLDSKHADWRTYENDMLQTLRAHPSMAHDPDRLYNMSIPPEVLEARATERALKRIQGTKEASSVQGTRTAAQTTSSKPEGKLSFNEAVEFAKQKLARNGVVKPLAG